MYQEEKVKAKEVQPEDGVLIPQRISEPKHVETAKTAKRNFRWKISNAVRYVLPYPRKVFNYLGLRAALLRGKTDHRFYPVKLGIEVSGRCNLSCPLCPRSASAERTEGNMQWDGYKRLIDTLSPYLFQVRLHGLGEPMLNPMLPQMVSYAHAMGIYTNFHTNGHFLDERNVSKLLESGLDEINIAMDGMSEATYSRYRVGGNLKRVRNGVIRLCQEKRRRKLERPRVNLQFLVMAHNEHEIPEISAFAEAAGVDRLYLKTVNIATGKESGNLEYLPSDPRYRRYRTDRGRLELTQQKQCSRVFMETVVNWDGTVNVCTGDHPDSRRIRGNFFHDAAADILFGEDMIRARAISLKKGYDSCALCMDADSPV